MSLSKATVLFLDGYKGEFEVYVTTAECAFVIYQHNDLRHWQEERTLTPVQVGISFVQPTVQKNNFTLHASTFRRATSKHGDKGTFGHDDTPRNDDKKYALM